MSEEEIKLIEIPYQKISLKPDDVITISLPAEQFPKETMDSIRNSAKRFFPNNKVMILLEGIKIGVVEKEETPEFQHI